MGQTAVNREVFDGFRKRSGVVVPFRPEKIKQAVTRAARVISERDGITFDDELPERVTDRVLNQLNSPDGEYYVYPDENNQRFPNIEDVQDLVEITLSELGCGTIVAAYKRYRKQREVARKRIQVREKDYDNVDVTDASLLLVQSVTDNLARPWDRKRIIDQLFEETDLSEEVAVSVAKTVENQVLNGNMTTLNSALIRELVNNELADRGYLEQLQELSLYRVPRNFLDQLMYKKSSENSNIVNNNPEAVNLGLAEMLLKQWALDTIFSPEVKRAHDTGAVHLHDLGYPHRVYCSSHSIEYVKKYGLKNLINLNTESKPARSASVLTGHLNTFLASMQANYAGALGIAYINILYAPLLSTLSEEQIKQVAQELIFNGSQNAFSRGGQTLFLDFNIHSGVPDHLKDVPAIGPGGNYMLQRSDGTVAELTEHLRQETDNDGNQLMDLYIDDETGKRLVLSERYDHTKKFYYDPEVAADIRRRDEKIVTYGDYQEEARTFARALLDVWAEGDRNGRVFEFPKCDFHVSEETFRDAEEYAIFERACALASQNGSTYFIFDRDEVTLSACCRLRTTIQDSRMLRHPESMRFCGFQNVTINIPQASYRAARSGNGSLEGLKEEVSSSMELAVQAHLEKRATTAELLSGPGRPLYQIGRTACDGRPYVELDKCTYIIGLIGLNDAIKFLTGEELHDSQQAMDMGLRLTAHMFLKAKELSQKYGLKISLEESPAESAARRLAKTDLVYFGDEASEVVKGDDPDSVYYTNSVHLAAEAEVSLPERIRMQAQFHNMIESGAITHAFVGEEKPSPASIANLMKEVFYRTQSAQVTISPEFTYCNQCYHNARGLLDQCPQCGSENVVGETRVVGYFSKIDNWNKSKRDGELKARHRGRYAVETADTAAFQREEDMQTPVTTT